MIGLLIDDANGQPLGSASRNLSPLVPALPSIPFAAAVQTNSPQDDIQTARPLACDLSRQSDVRLATGAMLAATGDIDPRDVSALAITARARLVSSRNSRAVEIQW